MLNCLVVNFCGGPGISKSTMSANVFAELKWLGVNCELVPEYAKEKVWEKSFHVLNNQRLVYGKQYHGILRAAENVDVVLTDSPLLLSAIYAKSDDEKFIDLIIDDFKKFRNINFLLERKRDFCQNGRIHTELQSIEIDKKIKFTMDKFQIEYIQVPGVKDSVPKIVEVILKRFCDGKFRYMS